LNHSETFQKFTIARVQRQNYRTYNLELDKPLPDARPGQYVMVWLPDVGEKPFSIACADPLLLTIAAVGPVSQALCARQAGDRIWVRGPLGNGFQLKGTRHILVGGGYGAAPLYFLAREARGQGEEVRVCLGARTAEDLLLVAEFRAIGCDVALATEDGSAGQKGLVLDAVNTVLRDFSADMLYACGPRPMLTALYALWKQKNQDGQFSWEAILRCGLGLCGSCELEQATCREVGLPQGWLTCKDGPVSFLNNR